MVDPELAYARLVSGDASALRAECHVLDGVLHDLDGVQDDLVEAATLPVWFGAAASMFAARVEGLGQGVETTRLMVQQARGAVLTTAAAYEGAVRAADFYIGFWRNRPGGFPTAIEELFARAVNARLLSVGRSYNEQLAAVAAVLRGEDLDLASLDEETRRWVEEGMAKNDEWLKSSGSELGPLIPHTAATGDHRGLVPQGLGYDPGSHTLVQGYYIDDQGAYLALIDEVTGRDNGVVRLGENYIDEVGDSVYQGSPSHAGGVTVDGDDVYVVDNGELYTYSLADLRDHPPGETVHQSALVQKGLSGGSYSAIKGDRLFLGDFETDTLFVYERNDDGGWVQVQAVETPSNCQGVHVLEDQFVFSASSGRHQNHSQLYVQNFDGTRTEPYDLPSMSQGVVVVDGDVVVTYESGAEKFDHAQPGLSGWWWGVDDYSDLWANSHMTRTPLSELGLGEDVEVAPSSLVGAAGEFAGLVGGVKHLAAELSGVRIEAADLGQVPRAASLSQAINKMTTSGGDSLLVGARAVAAVADLLESCAKDYARTDDRVDHTFRRLAPKEAAW